MIVRAQLVFAFRSCFGFAYAVSDFANPTERIKMQKNKKQTINDKDFILRYFDN